MQICPLTSGRLPASETFQNFRLSPIPSFVFSLTGKDC
jgi:hypothetical protein